MQNSSMNSFEYIPVFSLEEACSVLSHYGSDARILAGGTDLLIKLRKNTKAPPVIVDISFLSELRTISSSDGSVNVKPLATHTDIVNSEMLHNFAPILSLAASKIGSLQIRNRGTVGGNIMNAAACADTVPPLIALGATVTLKSTNGERHVNLADLFIEPYETQARSDELLTDIQFRKFSSQERSMFIKLGRRNALSITRLSVAAVLTQNTNKEIIDARIVPGAAFPVWQRVTEAEQILLGNKPSKALFTEAGNKVSEIMIASVGRRWSTEYKEPVMAALVRRALEQCV